MKLLPGWVYIPSGLFPRKCEMRENVSFPRSILPTASEPPALRTMSHKARQFWSRITLHINQGDGKTRTAELCTLCPFRRGFPASFPSRRRVSQLPAASKVRWALSASLLRWNTCVCEFGEMLGWTIWEHGCAECLQQGQCREGALSLQELSLGWLWECPGQGGWNGSGSGGADGWGWGVRWITISTVRGSKMCFRNWEITNI